MNAPKYPSPQSVLDDQTFMLPLGTSLKQSMKPPASRLANPIGMHRRVNSFDKDHPMLDNSSHGGSSRLAKPIGMHRRVNSFDPDSMKHRRVQSPGGVSSRPPSSQHRRTPSKGTPHRRGVHARSNSHSDELLGPSTPHRRTQSSSSNTPHRRTHSRSNSHSDDVFLHGIFAQTRMV